LKTHLRLTLSCSDTEAAKTLAAVLGPDNRSVPADQRFEMVQAEDAVSFIIESERLVSAFSSLDSVLSDASLFQEVWLLSRDRGTRET
jgi:hypothetical protein